MAAILHTIGLTKCFGSVVAVNRVNLRVDPGEIYAFIGLNGAGKSTTIRMLLGMIRPTEGSLTLFGKTLQSGRREVWRDIGYLVEGPAAYPELSVKENLEVSRRLYGLTETAAVDAAIDQFRLGEFANRRAGTLSTGNLQRLGLARAFLHRPRLVILDEPANGLDPAGMVEVRDLLTALSRREGVTVFMSSHLLAEVELLATRIGIIHQGVLIEELDAGELKSRRRKRLVIGSRDLGSAYTALLSIGYSPPRPEGNLLYLNEEKAVLAPEKIALALVEAGAPPTHLMVEEEDLEAFFLRITGSQE